MCTKLGDKEKLGEATILAEHMNFYIDNLMKIDLNDLNEEVELINLAYMFIEQLNILNLKMLELMK